MKILIYGMQSSGASLFTYFMSQKDNSIGIIDLYHDCLAPNLLDNHHDIILKCTVNTRYRIEDHQCQFKPDISILFIRDPIQNALRLSTKKWKDWSGTLQEKLLLTNDYFLTWRDHFDFLVTYEDFMFHHDLVTDLMSVSDYYYDFKRTLDEIVRFNCHSSDWCCANYMKAWGTGDIRIDLMPEQFYKFCPDLFDYYKCGKIISGKCRRRIL